MYSLIPDRELVRLDVFVEKIANGSITLSQYVDLTRHAIHNYVNVTGLKLIEEQIHLNESQLLAMPAGKLVFTIENGSDVSKFMIILLISKGNVYTIIYKAPSKVFDTIFGEEVRQIIESFRIGPVSSNYSNTMENGSNTYGNAKFGFTFRYPEDWSTFPEKDHIASIPFMYDVLFYGRQVNHALTLVSTTSAFEKLRYGMYIDSDSNNKTGAFGDAGIDYTYDIDMLKSDLNWSKTIQEWSSQTSGRMLEVEMNHPVRFDDSFGGEGFVTLSMDLGLMGFPDNYKVIFYAIIEDTDSNRVFKVGDYTKWALIPPPKMEISGSPNPTEIRRGDQTTIQILIKSTTQFEAQTKIGVDNGPLGNITLNSTLFPFIETSVGVSSLPFKVPPFGVVSIPVNVKIPGGTDIRPYTIPLQIDSSFPAELFVAEQFTNTTPSQSKLSDRIPTSEAIKLNETLDLTITVQKEVGLWDQAVLFIKDWGLIIGLIVGGAELTGMDVGI